MLEKGGGWDHSSHANGERHSCAEPVIMEIMKYRLNIWVNRSYLPLIQAHGYAYLTQCTASHRKGFATHYSYSQFQYAVSTASCWSGCQFSFSGELVRTLHIFILLGSLHDILLGSLNSTSPFLRILLDHVRGLGLDTTLLSLGSLFIIGPVAGFALALLGSGLDRRRVRSGAFDLLLLDLAPPRFGDACIFVAQLGGDGFKIGLVAD